MSLPFELRSRESKDFSKTCVIIEDISLDSEFRLRVHTCDSIEFQFVHHYRFLRMTPRIQRQLKHVRLWTKKRSIDSRLKMLFVYKSTSNCTFVTTIVTSRCDVVLKESSGRFVANA